MSKEHLCRCNNCMTIMYDENSASNSKKIEVPDNVVNMVKAKQPDGDVVWACPKCLVDDYLMDL